MDKVMLQFRFKGTEPSIEEAAELFGLMSHEIDKEFGVIATDPDVGLYTVLIDASAAKKAQSVLDERNAMGDEGVFSNPKVGATTKNNQCD